MEQSSTTIPRSAVRGSAIGVLFLAFFSTVWAGTGVIGLRGWGSPFVLFTAVFPGIVLFAGGISLLSKSRGLSNWVSEKGSRRAKRMGFWFNIISIVEGLAIGLAIAFCIASNQSDFLPAIIAIIVGIHFFPLAILFKVRLYYVTGSLLCSLVIIALLIVPMEVNFGGQKIIALLVIIGFGSSIILWATGLAIWLTVNRLLGSASNKA